MASASTMGLRRRTPVSSSPTPASQSSSTASSKRSRSENNNNSPSHGNLNSMNGGSRDEPPAKKSRGTSTSGAKGSSSYSASSAAYSSSASSSTTTSASSDGQSSKSRGTAVSRSTAQTKPTSTAATSTASSSMGDMAGNPVLTSSWQSGRSDMPPYASVTGLGMTAGQTAGLCAGNLGIPPAIPPYMSTSMATFVGNATNLTKNSSVSYLDISNMTGGSSLAASGAVNSLSGGYVANGVVDTKSGLALPFPGTPVPKVNGAGTYAQKGTSQNGTEGTVPPSRKFQNDAMFNSYQPWVIKTYGDLAKTKTVTIKKYGRILRTLRGEEVNSAENSKFRFWVKSKGFHIGQPEGYDAKPADMIIGRHALTSVPGMDPPLYVPTQLAHNKMLSGAEGTVPSGKVYKKVAIVENFFDIIHAVHVDLEGRPGKHAGQKRTYRTITETYAFLPREAVTRFLLGCTECQRSPRTPSPTNLSNQPQSTPLSPNPAGSAHLAASSSAPLMPASTKPRDSSHHSTSENKNAHNYRHQKHQKNATNATSATSATSATNKFDRDKDEKYNPLSITNLLKKDSVNNGFLASSDALPIRDIRRTPDSDRSSKSSASSKRKRMLQRTPSPQSVPLSTPWKPGLDPRKVTLDYSLPITISYLKHQKRLQEQQESRQTVNASQTMSQMAPKTEMKTEPGEPILGDEAKTNENDRFSPATGLIDTNLNLLATIQQLHCQVMLALTERLRPSITMPGPLVLPPAAASIANIALANMEVSVQTGENPS